MDPNVLQNMCRICMTGETDVLISLFSKFHKETIAKALIFSTGVEVEINDNMPENICETCFKDLIQAFFFVKRTRASDEILGRLFKCKSTVSLVRMESDDFEEDNNIQETNDLPDEKSEDLLDEQPIVVHLPAESKEPLDSLDPLLIEITPKIEILNIPNFLADNDNDLDEEKQTLQSELKVSESPVNYDNHFEDATMESDNEEDEKLLEELPMPNNTIDNSVFECHVKEIKIDGLVCCSGRCFKIFASETELKEHVDEMHRNKIYHKRDDTAFFCQKCYGVFKEKKSYENHLTFLNNEENVLECDICKLRFLASKRSNIIPHIKKHFENGKLKDSVVIPDEQKLSIEDAKINSHIQEIKIDGVFCCSTKCYETFPNEKQLKEHIDIKHSLKRYRDNRSSDFKCEKCTQIFQTKEQFYRHKKHTTGIDKLLQCGICNARFLTAYKFGLRKHIKDHFDKEGNLKPIQPLGGYNVEEMRSLYGFLCCGQGCNLSFENEDALIKHAHKDHLNTKMLNKGRSKTKPYECKTCFRRFDKLRVLNTHLKRKYLQQNNAIACDQCGKKVKRCDLDTHMAKHNDEKPFICDTCGKRFVTKIKISAHVKTHVQFSEFKCKICDIKFKLKHYLNQHMIKHRATFLFSCNLCAYKCMNRFSLKEHQRVHTGEKPFPCRYCEDKFSDITNRNIHEVRHTNLYPYNCSTCGKGFLRKSLFVKHKH